MRLHQLAQLQMHVVPVVASVVSSLARIGSVELSEPKNGCYFYFMFKTPGVPSAMHVMGTFNFMRINSVCLFVWTGL